MITKKLILEKLSKKEAHELLSLCSQHFPFPFKIIKEQHDQVVKEKNPSKYGGFYLKRLKQLKRIHDLYLRVTPDETDYMSHWHIMRSIQSEKGRIYKHNDKPERKDNKDSYNYGNHDSRGISSVRFPSKKRKTAWKRFYKLFPSLKPKEEISNENLTK
jgi:hypothetical protein